MTVIHSTPNSWNAHFESVTEAADFLDNTPVKYDWGREFTAMQGSIFYEEHSWTLGHGSQKVRQLARAGWPNGVQSISEQLRVAPPALERDSTWRYDVAGYMPDIPRYLSGAPDHMMRHGHPKGHRPVVSLCVQVWINSGITAMEMMNYGAAMIHVIDMLEQHGRRVELWAGVIAPHSYMKNRTIMAATWVVKHAQDHVDLADMAFSLAHPGASRRFGWEIWGRSDKPNDPGMGQGGYTPTMADVLDPPAGMLFLAGAANNYGVCNTVQGAMTLIAKQVNAAAGETIVELEGV